MGFKSLSNKINSTDDGGSFDNQAVSTVEVESSISVLVNSALAHRTAAETAKTAAETAETNAETAEANAETAETNAETAETNSATSSTNSGNSATASANSATASSNSAGTASTQATNASNSATAASNSATAASNSATGANSSATTATTKASEASTSATNAATAKTNAETAETNAETAETNAAASASTASTHASTATTKASEASTSATNAATSATNSSNSASAASSSASSATTQANTATTQATNSSNSASAAATSATAAQTAKTNAETAETNSAASRTAAANSATGASNSQIAAASSAASAAAIFDQFDDTYLGSKSSEPTVDNDGNALVTGALFYNSSTQGMFIWTGSDWVAASSAGGASLNNFNYTATAGQTSFSGSDENSNTMSYTVDNIIVTLNGVVLEGGGTDYTATNGSSIVLATGAVVSDEVNIVAFKTFTTADMVSASNGGAYQGNVDFAAGIDVTGNITVTGTVDGVDVAAFKSSFDALDLDGDYVNSTGDTMTGNLSFGDNDKAIFGASSDLLIYHDGTHSLIRDNGTGELRLEGENSVRIGSVGSSETYIMGQKDGAVRLYYDNAQKLATTSTGIDVTGTVTADAGSWSTVVSGNAITFDRNGENNIIADSGSSANLNLTAGNRIFYSADDYQSFKIGSSPTEKLRILSTGIDVTGTAVMDGLTMGDGHTLALGDSSEFTIRHTSGGNTNISESGSGNLNISARDLFIQDIAGTNRLKVDGNLGDISFYEDTGTTAKFFWDASAESLGIGTSAPATALHVRGTASTAGANRSVVTLTDDTAMGINVGSGVAFRGLYTSSGAEANYGGIFAGKSNANSGNANGYLSLSYSASGTLTEGMRINSSGNVGIGVSSPATTLHIDSGGTPTTIRIDGDTEASILLNDHGGSAKAYKIGTNISSNDGHLEFKDMTANAERMRIDTSGKVGIGTTSPTRQMSVENTLASGGGSIGITSSDSSTSGSLGIIHFGNSTDSSLASIGGLADGSTSAGALLFKTEATGGAIEERMRITSAGNVGLNLASPSEQLSTLGNVNIGNNDSSNPLSYLRFGATQHGAADIRPSDEGGHKVGLDFYTDGTGDVTINPTFAMRIDGSGNVGIGTNSPTGAGTILHLNGSGTVADFHMTNTTSGVASTDGFIMRYSGLNAEFLNREAGANIFYTSATERMRIDSSGHAIIPAGVTLGTSAGVYSAANTLDDYEEGTWTPTLGGNASYSIQSGTYVKVGRLVSVQGVISVTTLGTGSTTVMTGLPFQSSNAGGGNMGGSITYFAGLAVNVIAPTTYLPNSSDALLVKSRTSAGTDLNANVAIFGNSARVDFSITYETAS